MNLSRGCQPLNAKTDYLVRNTDFITNKHILKMFCILVIKYDGKISPQ